MDWLTSFLFPYTEQLPATWCNRFNKTNQWFIVIFFALLWPWKVTCLLPHLAWCYERNRNLRPEQGRGKLISSQQKHLAEQLEALASRVQLQACLQHAGRLEGTQGLLVTNRTATAWEGNRKHRPNLGDKTKSYWLQNINCFIFSYVSPPEH